MKTTTEDVKATREMLGDRNPVSPVAFRGAVFDEEGQASLRRILATPADLAPKPRRSLVLVGLGAAASVVLVVAAVSVLLLGLPGPGSHSRAYAATPPMLHYLTGPGTPADDLLIQLAAAAESQPPDVQGDGPVQYLRIQTWDLDTAVSGGTATSTVDPKVIDIWRGDNGSGRIVSTSEDGSVATDDFSPGELAGPDASILSTDPEVLGDQLLGDEVEGNSSGVPDDVERVMKIEDVLRWNVIGPQLEAAMWRVLSSQGLVDLGPVTDRAGRQGVAVGLDSDYSGLPTSYRLIIDPSTGLLLSTEEILTTDAGQLNVPIPSVIAYTAYLQAGRVGTIGSRP